MAIERRPSDPGQTISGNGLREGLKPFTQVSGLVVASDGVKNHSPLDVLNSPIYGGWKLLLKDKILNKELLTAEGTPLVEPVIQAMFESTAVSDFVIVRNEDQCDYLADIASKNDNGKPHKIVTNRGHIGEVVAEGADNIAKPGYLFAVMPDLPYANGAAIDFAVADILRAENLGADVYLPVISSNFLANHGGNWRRPFSRLRHGKEDGQFGGINFVIASSTTINPEAIKKYYDIRTIHSLKGKLNAARHFPTMVPEIALSYLANKLSINTLEEMGSELYRGELRVMLVSDPIYISFMKDIDTFKDYQIYRDEQRQRIH